MKTSFDRSVRLAGFAVMACGVLLTGCGGQDSAPTAQTGDTGHAAALATAGATVSAAAREPVRPVRTLVVGATALTEARVLPGEVRARHEQRLGFRVGGKLARRAVEVGDAVKPGQLLAELDAEDVLPAINTAAAQVEVAHADVMLQQAELKRVQALRERGFVGAAQ
ncbi:MAG: biotin/lipoyl-binding protein, partial [Casimicrobiaceae bacterium]